MAPFIIGPIVEQALAMAHGIRMPFGAVDMVGGEVRTVANEGQCAGILTPAS